MSYDFKVNVPAVLDNTCTFKRFKISFHFVFLKGIFKVFGNIYTPNVNALIIKG